MTLAELERWMLERNWGLRRKLELAQHLARYIVLPVSRESCANGAEIAASVLHDPVPLITNNRGRYSAVDGLALLSAQIALPADVVRPRGTMGWRLGLY